MTYCLNATSSWGWLFSKYFVPPGEGEWLFIGIYCGLNFRLALSGHKDRGSKYHGASFTALTVCCSTIKPCFKHVKGFWRSMALTTKTAVKQNNYTFFPCPQ
ncbi:MAG: hypothetical protein ACJAXE_003190 [Neolewinella sp.]|jgi:hypothetical protein